MSWQTEAAIWHVCILIALVAILQFWRELCYYRWRRICPYCRSVGIAQNEMGYCRACGARWRLR